MDTLEEWKKKNKSFAGYAHFDSKSINLDSCWSYISDSDKISKHSFLPFITYDQVFYKFYKENKTTNKSKSKIRKICYSSHLDRCIYKYYSFLLNNYYNEYCDTFEIHESVIAYRSNLGKNNIHFAKKAFDFITKENCIILVGDFSNFFDNLDHKYLKRRLCDVLNVNTLDDDWYAIFKNITKYSEWDLISLLKLNGLISDKNIKAKKIAEQKHDKLLNGNTYNARKHSEFFDYKIRKLNKQKVVLSKKDFKKYKKHYLKYNMKSYGIPQGSAISAILSNVYMIEFDKEINKFTSEHDGLYLRYSDDFIIVLPIKEREINDISDKLKIFLNKTVEGIKNLFLQKDKTKVYLYKNDLITDTSNNNDSIDYLGFLFDGKEVTLRAKTVSKYYYRMYRKLRSIIKNKGCTRKGNKVNYRNLYETYTRKGRSSGNFFSYVHRADILFNDGYSSIKHPVTNSTKRHMAKIRKARKKLNSKLNNINKVKKLYDSDKSKSES